MRLYPGKEAKIVGYPGMSIDVPDHTLYVDVLDYPNGDGTVDVSFTMKIKVNVSDLQER